MEKNNHPMNRVYKVLANSPELTDTDLKNLPMNGFEFDGKNSTRELIVLYEKLGEENKQNVLNFAKQCLKEETRVMV